MSEAMKLNGKQREILREAIIGAYPNPDKLKILLSEQMEVQLGAIARGDTYDDRIFSLIDELNADGRIEELIKLIVNQKPKSPYLTKVKNEFAGVYEIDFSSTEVLINQQELIKWEQDAIVLYDLKPLVRQLQDSILGYEGAFAFSLGEDVEILKHYVIPRIQKELEHIVDRCSWEIKSINITRKDIPLVNIEKFIESKFLSNYARYQQFVDCFRDNNDNYKDIILVIYNFSIPLKFIRPIAFNCWKYLKTKAEPFLTQKSRCFVMLWVNTGSVKSPLDVEEIISLPIPKFEVRELVEWFPGKLRSWGLKGDSEEEREMIEDFQARLAEQQGDIARTFHEIRTIFYELKALRVIHVS